jgi:RNA polymerase sigma factor (sigma-70 family)
MSAEDPGSVTRWLERLKAGQPDAAEALWRRYYDRVVAVVRQHLQRAPPTAAEDAEDAALSALHGLFAGAAQGRFEWLSDRVDLWQLLVVITVKKALCQRRRYDRLRRGGSHVTHGQAALRPDDDAEEDHGDPLAFVYSHEPTPESAAIIQEQFQKLLDELPDPPLRQIALWRMEGLSNAEIAAKMGCVVRTVERKLERIRFIWQEVGIAPDE